MQNSMNGMSILFQENKKQEFFKEWIKNKCSSKIQKLIRIPHFILINSQIVLEFKKSLKNQ